MRQVTRDQKDVQRWVMCGAVIWYNSDSSGRCDGLAVQRHQNQPEFIFDSWNRQ